MLTETPPTITLKQLEPFLSQDETRLALCKPWFADGYTWATDGRILVRVPGRVENIPDRTADEPKPPNAMSSYNTWKKLPDAPEWTPLPQVIEATIIECEKCDGDGRWECNCPSCPTFHECDDCGGDGKYQKVKGQDVGNRILSEKLLAKVATLPNPMLCLYGEPGDVVRFKFDGGEGVLMPMRKKND